MDIKFIKRLTDSYKIKHILSFFWDYELKTPFDEGKIRLYWNVLSKQKHFDDIHEVFEIIKTTFFLYPRDVRKGWYRKKEINYLKDFSEQLYGDRQYWTKGTEIERLSTESEERRKQHQYNYEDLQFLYDVLGLRVKKHRNNDFVYAVARYDELSSEIINANQSEPLTKENVFCICEKYILTAIETKMLKRPLYYLMCSISYFAYGDNKYWITKNQLHDNETIAAFRSQENNTSD